MKTMRPGIADAFARVEQELQEERVSALARIGRRLETLLRSLDEVSGQLEGAGGSERVPLVERYRHLHAEARLYRWYLEVQRESMGLTRHEAVDWVFRMPPLHSTSTAGDAARLCRGDVVVRDVLRVDPDDRSRASGACPR